MSDATAMGSPTVHRTWPWECVVIRGTTPDALVQALAQAAHRVEARMADGGQVENALAVWAAMAEPGDGPLAASVVADSATAAAEKLRRAAAEIAGGANRIDVDGVYFERDPPSLGGRVAWLFSGTEGVAPGMFRELSLLLPGVTRALDEAAEQDPDPGLVADYLYGPGSGGLDLPGRTRLACAAGRAMTSWLLRLLPAPWRAVGGPGMERPWLDTESLETGSFADPDPDAVAASGGWGPILQGLRDDGAILFVHAGPGRLPSTDDDIIDLQGGERGELYGLLHGLARLAAAGLAVDLRPLFQARGIPGPAAAPAPKRRGMPIAFQPRSPRFDARAILPPAAAPSAPAPPPGTVPAASPADASSRVVLEHLQTMELFLEQQQRAVHRFLGEKSEAPPPLAAPLLTQVTEHQPGHRLRASAQYQVEEAVFLKQHTPNVSAVSTHQSDAFGLPVMPLTFSLEVLAEVASLLVPGKVVTGFDDVVARHWMSFERDSVDVVAEAEVVESGEPTVVSARLCHARDPTRLYLSGRVLLASAYPAVPHRVPWSVPRGRPCHWGVEDVYPARGFHGPLLQAITGVDEHGDAGMTGSLTILPRAPLFASAVEPAFHIDPVLLDSLGMGVGVWTWPEAMNGVYPVPFKVQQIRLYGPPRPEGERLRMEVRITRRDEFLMDADLAAIRPSGELHAEAMGWQDYVYRLPVAIHRIAADPFTQLIADPLPWPGGQPGGDDRVVCAFPALGADFFDAGDGIWEKILAWFSLSPPERQTWLSMEAVPERRRSWLRGRVSVKDAVRHLLAARGIVAGAYDVEITREDGGRPRAGGAWSSEIPDGITISLAHAGEMAVAVAGDRARGTLGIDVESPSAMNDDVAGMAFSPQDREHLGEDRAWLTRAWCAKEAVAKALGTGFRHDPRALAIIDVDVTREVICIRPQGPWLASGCAPSEIKVMTRDYRDHVVALCRIQN